MNINTIMALVASVSITLAIAFTIDMPWYSCSLFSFGLMIVLDNIMRDKCIVIYRTVREKNE